MFTGIVEQLGNVESIRSAKGGGKVLTIRAAFDALEIGESIAHDGVCLTVTTIEGPTYAVDVGPETLSRTTLGQLNTGDRINLERSMALGDRIGGHLVQGHVDCVGTVRTVTRHENAYDLEIEVPPELAPLLAPRGSIAIDGVSLTVTTVSKGYFGVMIIPHTWAVTTLSERRVGSTVNLEADMIARYVARTLESRGPQAGSRLTETYLKDQGF